MFYSDPSSHAAMPTEHQVHCLHCGKEVDIVTTDDPDKSISSNGQQPDIVQPPAGFADSPRQKHGRLYKKLEKRFRSEDRSHGERRHHKYRPDVRAKVCTYTRILVCMCIHIFFNRNSIHIRIFDNRIFEGFVLYQSCKYIT